MDTAKTTSPYNPSPLESKQNSKIDLSTLGYGQQYVPTLKTVGYVIGQPLKYGISVGEISSNVVKPVTPNIATTNEVINTSSRTQIFRSASTNNIGNMSGNKINSRLVCQQPVGGVIVHEHPSRPSRSPSPIGQNPQSNLIPRMNFIYNSSTSPPPSRVISPANSPPIISTVVHKQPSVIVSQANTSVGMVPRAQYERCVSQCKTWQQKYNELYNILLKNSNDTRNNRSFSANITSYGTNSQEYDYMLKQNKRLKQRVRELEQNQQRLVTNMDDIITSLVNKYRDSTLKQCMLLTDRYRLEKKMNQKM